MESIRFMDGRCIVSMVDRKTMDFYNAVPGDLDGIVNQLRNIKGIDCAIFMYETGVLEYKVACVPMRRLMWRRWHPSLEAADTYVPQAAP